MSKRRSMVKRGKLARFLRNECRRRVLETVRRSFEDLRAWEAMRREKQITEEKPL